MNPQIDAETMGLPCSLLRRVLVIIYDAVVVIALLLMATAIAMLLGMANHTAAKDPLFTAYLFLVWFLYLGWCWNRGGMTLGMRAWRVCIKDESGNHPAWGRCAVRFLLAFISAAVAGLGFFWSLFEADRRTWHDMASGTRLLRY